MDPPLKDRRIPEDVKDLLNVRIDDGNVEVALGYMTDLAQTGWWPTNSQLHTCLLLACHYPPKPSNPKRRADSDRAVKVLQLVSSHLHTPWSSLTALLPTCERESAEEVTEYTANYPLQRDAKEFVRRCNGGVWDLVLETRSEREERLRREEIESDKVGKKRKKGKEPGRTGKKLSRGRGAQGDNNDESDLSSLSDEEEQVDEDEEDEEVVNDRSWGLLSWLVDLFSAEEAHRKEKSTVAPFSQALLDQLHQSNGLVTDISRPMAVVKSAISSTWKDRWLVAARLLQSLRLLTATEPAKLEPQLLLVQLSALALSLPLFATPDLIDCLDTSLVAPVLRHAIRTVSTGQGIEEQSVIATLGSRIEGSGTAREADAERLVHLKVELMRRAVSEGAEMSEETLFSLLWPFKDPRSVDVSAQGWRDAKMQGTIREAVADIMALRAFHKRERGVQVPEETT